MNIPTNPRDFNGLVNEDMKASSRTIAEKFGKQHKDVLRAIRNLDCSSDFNERNFAPVEYLDAKGEVRTEYAITRDGFTFLAMGFTGKEAAAWKERYIAAFNAMEQRLKAQPAFQIPQTYPEALKLAAEQAEQIEAMKPKVAAIERLSGSEGRVGFRVAAKTLGMAERKFGRWLFSNRWRFLQGKTWQGYADKVRAGYIENYPVTYQDKTTGEDKTKIEMGFTPKGLAKLAEIFAKEGLV